MKKKVRRGNLAVRALAMVVTFSMVVSLMTVLGGEASAATSLTGIESIKDRGSLSILEIVPQEGTGSIGYYVAGREPTNGWLNVLAGKATANERDQYAENLLSSLKNANLMGDPDTDYPLIYTGNYTTSDGYYKEYLPWDRSRPSNAYPVTLTKTEEAKVNGSFTLDASGDYIKADTYELSDGGDYVENVLYYEYGPDNKAEGSNYYYRLTFEKVDTKNTPTSDLFRKPLYTLKPDSLFPGNTYYEYAGTLEERDSVDHDDFTIDENTDYYKAELVRGTSSNDPTVITDWVYLEDEDGITFTADELITGNLIPKGHDLIGSTLYTLAEQGGYNAVQIEEGTPVVPGMVYYKLKENAYSYHAVTPSNPPFINAETPGTGFFDEKPGYEFVGDGKGDHTFEPSSTGSLWNLVYDTVYVTGGYTNSNWFKRYVLDMDGVNDDLLSSMRISVTSVTPNQLQEDMVKNANLVVVSAGFDRTKQGSTVTYTRDITDTKILNELTKKPRVVDSRISGASNLASLGDGTTNPGVKVINNVDVYNFAAGSGTDARSALATPQFHTPFSTTTPYQVVADEITYVNLLRSTMNQEPLSTEISMATCIRYLLNTHLPVNHKTELRVLDIQPLAKKYTDHTTHINATNSCTLSVETVQSWLPENAFTNDKIKITHMSSAELICNIDNLSENYDLIYIGANAYGNNLPDDMYYANIGKEVGVDTELKGLLSGDLYSTNSNPIKARYSGNDLTPTKSAELVAFANAGLPIVVADKLTSGLTTTQERTLTASISANRNDKKMTVTPTLAPSASNATYAYQWYIYTGDDSRFAEPVKDGGTESTYTPSEPVKGDRYFCRVTATIGDATRFADSNTLEYTFEGTNDSYYLEEISGRVNRNFSDWQDIYYFSSSVVEDDLEDGKLTVETPRKSRDSNNTRSTNNLTYTWKRLDSNGRKDDTWSKVGGTSYTPTMDGNEDYYYYCEITIGYQRRASRRDPWGEEQFETIISPAYRPVKENGSSTSQNYYTAGPDTSRPGTFESAISGTATLDPTKVDGHSLMYTALNSVWSLPNVVVQKSVQREDGKTPSQALIDKQHTLLQHLNLSRPSITLTSKPPVYEAKLSTTNGIFSLPSPTDDNCGGTLNFSFTIQNPTDPTPLQTKYTCKLYIDQNGDGRHMQDEEIGDLALTAVNGELVAGTPYTLSRTINQQFTGMIAWKLEVVKVGDETACGSQKGYTYNQPRSATHIDVLQILPINTGHADLANDNEFKKLYKTLSDNGMYDVSVTTVNVQKLNNKELDLNKDGEIDQADKNATADDLYQNYLANYNMLVIGFADVYQDLLNDTAPAVARYIDSGKAVLFTHDTTSFYSAADTTNPSTDENPKVFYKYWGYEFNKFIRDKVGLDRYGVTNSAFGSKQGTGSNATYGAISAGTDGAITVGGTMESNLLGAGYTVAYVPYTESATKQSSGATQGFTDLNINRFSLPRPPSYQPPKPGYSNESKTKTVSQVNEGQITQYPFTLHEESTDKLNRTLTVARTHNQYYQLNMNPDVITGIAPVVWYCLSGNGSGGTSQDPNYDFDANHYNDGTNAYYIYNHGNITYSGAGHDEEALTLDEKTLFVNTMVAAYRAARTAPTVQFVTASGQDTTTQLVTAEEGTSLNMNQPFFFKLTDTNLTARKSLSVELYYEVPKSVAQKAASDANKDLSDYTLESAGLAGSTVPDDGSASEDNTKYVLKASLGDNIYRADTGVKVSDPNNLSSGVIYRTPLPQAVLKNFTADISDLTIYLKVITKFNNDNNNTLSGKDDLSLKKLGLLRLE